MTNADRTHTPVPEELNRITDQIIGAAIEVHRRLGPGLLESIYEKALIYEMGLRGLRVQSQVPVRVRYKDIEIEGQRVDLLVERDVIVELKAVDRLLSIHEAQLLSYLKSAE